MIKSHQKNINVKISGTNNGRHWPRHTFGMADHGHRGGKRHASNSAGTTLYVVAHVGQCRSLLWKVCLFFLPFFFDFFFFLISLYELVVNILDTLWQIIRSLGILISCWIYCNIPKIYHLIISLSLKRSWREENFGQPLFLRGLHNIF